MSLQSALNDAVAKVMDQYISSVSQKYNIEKTELLGLWKNSGKDCGEDVKEVEEINVDYLLKCKKQELQVLCKKKGVKHTGTKAQLIGYLQGKTASPQATPRKEVTPRKTKAPATKQPTVVENITKKVPVIAIRKNQFGNHEHPETTFVFDIKTKKAIGKQNEDGTIKSLEKEDIDVCNKYKFEYVIPANLDAHSNLEDEKVDELEDEEYEEEEVEEEVEEDELFEEYEEEYEEEVEE